MATVEQTARARNPGSGLGWEGRSLLEMLEESERLFAETGHYGGPAGARVDALGPDRLREAVLATARRARVGPLDRAEHLGLADRARARRAVLRAVHPRGRLDRPVDGDHRARPHDVRCDQVDGPQRLRTEPRDPARRHLCQQRPDHRRRPQRRRPDVRADLLGGRADRMGGRRDARAGHRGEHPRRRPRGTDDALRRRHRPAVHEDRRGRRARALAPRALSQAHPRLRLLPARRAHAPGRLPHDPRLPRAPARRGRLRALQALQPRGDRGGQAVVQVAHPRDDRPGPLPLAGDLRCGVRRQAAAAGARPPRHRDALPVRGAHRRGRHLLARLRRRLRVGMALDELHPLGHAGSDLGDVHADADLQRQDQRRRLLCDRDELPRGDDRQPRLRRGLNRDRLGLPATVVHRLPAHDLARPPGTRIRGGDPLDVIRCRATSNRVAGSTSTGTPRRS